MEPDCLENLMTCTCIQQRNVGKSIKFDAEDETNGSIEAENTAVTSNSVVLDDNDEEPEVVNSNDISVQRLKELHQSLSNRSLKEKKSKRRRTADEDFSNQAFDVSLLVSDSAPQDITKPNESNVETSNITNPIIIENITERKDKIRRM
jgi:hypothetical protein